MKFPTFSLPADNDKTYSEQDFAKGTFVLFLYPKDMTSGCTVAAQNFRDSLADFKKVKTEVIGISKDPLKRHLKFREKEELNFPLISDEESTLIDALGSWKEKSMYGKKYMGTDRSTFVIQNGEIIKEWRKVKVPGHVQEVLEFVKGL